MKTIERAHMPDKLWERVKLPKNYEKALEIIDKHLMYWPKLLVHKNKQRLTKMTQMRIRMRKLALKTREKIMTIPRKEIKRESRRQEKAEKAANLEKSIETKLLGRLKKGVYEGIFNIPIESYLNVIDKAEQEEEEEEQEGELETVYVEGYEDLEEEDDIEDFGGLSIEKDDDDDDHDDDDNDDDDDVEDDEDEEESAAIHRKRGRKTVVVPLKKIEKRPRDGKSKKRPRGVVEVEHEVTNERQQAVI
jgi:protein MAK16